MPQTDQPAATRVTILAWQESDYGRTISSGDPWAVARAAAMPRARARTARAQRFVPYITRKIPYYEVLGEEGLELLEHNADTILEEIGIDFRDDPEALEIWKSAGADVQGERVHFPRGMCRTLVQALGAAGIHPARAQPGAHRPDRRQPHGVCAGLRLAVRAQPRRGPSLRDDRGLPQFREARLRVAPRCTTPAAPSASRSTCPSTSGTSTWCTAT